MATVVSSQSDDDVFVTMIWERDYSNRYKSILNRRGLIMVSFLMTTYIWFEWPWHILAVKSDRSHPCCEGKLLICNRILFKLQTYKTPLETSKIFNNCYRKYGLYTSIKADALSNIHQINTHFNRMSFPPSFPITYSRPPTAGVGNI